MAKLICVGHVSCGRTFKGTGRNKYCTECRAKAAARHKAQKKRIKFENSADMDAARREEIHRGRVAEFRGLFLR